MGLTQQLFNSLVKILKNIDVTYVEEVEIVLQKFSISKKNLVSNILWQRCSSNFIKLRIIKQCVLCTIEQVKLLLFLNNFFFLEKFKNLQNCIIYQIMKLFSYSSTSIIFKNSFLHKIPLKLHQRCKYYYVMLCLLLVNITLGVNVLNRHQKFAL